jgi:hypothetical protein
MSFLALHAKAAIFFVLGVFVTGVVVATTHAAAAQFGRAHAVSSIRWTFTRADVPARGQTVIEAKCLSTESVISGGYKLVNVNDGADVHILQSYPDNYENAYVVIVANSLSSPIVAYSDVGCQPK